MSAKNSLPARVAPDNRLVKALLLSTALTSLAGVAQAQVAKEATTAAAAASTGLEEVVVTARRRSEDLQSTPVSVTAFSADLVNQLNVRNFADLRFAVPNLELGTLASGASSMTIRGIGQTSTQVNVDAKAGFYIDEMYVARQEGNQLYFYDIDNLQVLKGPQGTLFGKNTTAGAVLLTTARPTADGGGYVKLRGGNYRKLDTEGAVNLPVSDKLLTRFSFRTQFQDGYIKHVLDDETNNDTNDKSVRAQLRALPTDKYTIDLLGEYNRSNTNGPSSSVVNCNPAASYQRNYTAVHLVDQCTAYPLLNDPHLVYGGATLSIPTSAQITDTVRGGDYNNGLSRGGHRGSYNDTAVSTLNLRQTYDLTPHLTLKSITAYRHSGAHWYTPTINAPNDIYAENDQTATNQFTQEFNLNGSTWMDRLNYTGGVYFFSQHTHFIQDTGPDYADPVGYTYAAKNFFKSWAAYAQISLKIIEPLELTVGTRYSHDKKSATSDVFLQTVTTGRCAATPATTVNGVTTPARTSFYNAFVAGSAVCGGHLLGASADSWHSFDPKVDLSYQVNDDFFLYGGIAKGYNAGGFNQQLASSLGGQLVSYDPEKLTSYEVGAKTEWWDKRVRLNASYFRQNYSDIQTTVQITFNGITTRQVQTGASAREHGIEADIELLPTKDLRIRGNVAILKQRYTAIRPGASLTLATPVTTAPEFTYSFNVAYTLHPSEKLEIVPSLNWRASGSRPSCNPVGTCTLPPYGILGGRVDFRPTDSDWSASAYITNALDIMNPSAKNQSNTNMGISTITTGRPREYGVEITRRF